MRTRTSVHGIDLLVLWLKNGHSSGAHENGCDWDEYTYCECAASKNGHRVFEIRARKREVSLESKKYMVTSYAHENGCPWDERTCSCAADGHLECLTHARESWVSFGRRASRPGLLLRLRLRLRREFQRSRLLRYALVKVNKDAIKYYTLVIQTPTKNTPQCYSSSSSS